MGSGAPASGEWAGAALFLAIIRGSRPEKDSRGLSHFHGPGIDEKDSRGVSQIMHRWAEAGRPLVFGHRGGSRLAPENTLAAFDRGVAEGVDGLEMDVRLAADGEVVVCHDATVDRTTDGAGAISSMTARQLAALDAGSRFAGADGRHPFRGRGLGIPALRDVVCRYPHHRLIVEMKDSDPALARAVVGILRAAEALERVCVGSFHAAVMGEARRLEPGLATSAAQFEVRMALYRSWVGWFPRRVPYAAMQVPERREATTVVSRRFVRAAHRAGVAVQVWVVDQPADMERLLDWGVDGLITDRPDVAVGVVRRWSMRR
jgi:glycerophosphoryl diester phosphodiesterase